MKVQRMGSALKDRESFGFRWISFPLFDLMILVFGLTACLWALGNLEFGPDFRLPAYGMGEPDRKPWKNRLTINLSWDGATGVSTCWVKRTVFTLDQLKTWMYPIARSKINKKTKFSEIPVHIRAPGDMPFSEIRKVLDVCRDKDIQIYQVKIDTRNSGSG